MIQALIVDDESRARQSLIQLLRMYCPDVEQIREAADGDETLHLIQQKVPDVVFMDVDLKTSDAFSLLNEIGTYPFKLIFVTAHSEFAVKAFKYAAVDYLLKPVNPEELVNAVARSLSYLDRKLQALKFDVLLNNMQHTAGFNKKIVLRTSTEVYLINSKDIVRLEADHNYTVFYLKDKRRIVMSVTLKEYESMLEGLGFFRPHQSHLINMDFFDGLTRRTAPALL
jgi:two-component system LytT family response regulator